MQNENEELRAIIASKGDIEPYHTKRHISRAQSHLSMRSMNSVEEPIIRNNSSHRRSQNSKYQNQPDSNYNLSQYLQKGVLSTVDAGVGV